MRKYGTWDFFLVEHWPVFWIFLKYTLKNTLLKPSCTYNKCVLSEMFFHALMKCSYLRQKLFVNVHIIESNHTGGISHINQSNSDTVIAIKKKKGKVRHGLKRWTFLQCPSATDILLPVWILNHSYAIYKEQSMALEEQAKTNYYLDYILILFPIVLTGFELY